MIICFHECAGRVDPDIAIAIYNYKMLKYAGILAVPTAIFIWNIAIFGRSNFRLLKSPFSSDFQVFQSENKMEIK